MKNEDPYEPTAKQLAELEDDIKSNHWSWCPFICVLLVFVVIFLVTKIWFAAIMFGVLFVVLFVVFHFGIIPMAEEDWRDERISRYRQWNVEDARRQILHDIRMDNLR